MRLLSKAKQGSLLRVLETHWVYTKRDSFNISEGRPLLKGSPLVLLTISSRTDTLCCLTEFGVMWVNPEYVMMVMT
jgi:hypothetical protein